MAPEITNKLGVTPTKLAVIAGLALVLLIVVAIQLSSSDTGTSGEKISPRPKPRGGRNAVAATSAASSAAAGAKKTAWPILSREEVQQHNPFHVSFVLAPTTSRTGTEAADGVSADDEASRQAESDDAALQREELLAELRGDGVDLIVLSEDGQVAKIGEKRIRVGDIIRGFRVVEIAADGIVLVEHKAE